MTSASHLIGSSIGPYEIQALIGSGGMASVYRGFDQNLGRLVAIKMLSGAAAAQPGFEGRFRQEARLIAALRHPNIVHVYDLGSHNGLPFMVQELLPGPTLEQHLHAATAQGRQLPPAEVTAIVAQLAAALDAAHSAGIVHRDVKPANAMWNGSGALVLTDFGIARNTLATVNQTQAGLVLGTPRYLAPEQAQGLPVTPASDIYSLGVVAYELLAGRVPFDGNTPLGVALNHVQTPPPPLRPLRPDLPPAVDAVVLRALAKDPAARFLSAGEFAVALERAWLTSTPGVSSTGVHTQPTTAWQAPGGAQAPGAPGAGPPLVGALPPLPAPPFPTPSLPAPTPATSAGAATTHMPAAPPLVGTGPGPAAVAGSTQTTGGLPALPAAPAPQTPRLPGAARRRLPLLLILGGLLLLLLLCAAVMAIGSAAANRLVAPTGVAAPSTPVAAIEPPAAPSAPPPTTAPLPTTAPPTAAPVAVAPTTAPPTAAPVAVAPTSASPPEAPVASANPLADLGVLIETGIADGRARDKGEKLVDLYNELVRELSQEDLQKARDKLRELRKEISNFGQKEEIDPAFAAEALAGVQAVADQFAIDLGGGGEDGDDD